MEQASREYLHIENFGGIKEMTIELRPMTVLIGPQTSGKSITAKLLYYFRSFFEHIYSQCAEGADDNAIDLAYLKRFVDLFPSDAWHEGVFSIEYSISKGALKMVGGRSKQPKFTCNGHIRRAIEKCRSLIEKAKVSVAETGSRAGTRETSSVCQYLDYLSETFGAQVTSSQRYIPADRSFLAKMQANIFSLIHDRRPLDPFFVEFASFYESYSHVIRRDANEQLAGISSPERTQINSLIGAILSAEYVQEIEQSYLRHSDGRKVRLMNASSGQQATLPLIVFLKALFVMEGDGLGTTIYIEEPEAHIFPTAQKKIIELIATLFKYTGQRFQFVITTHSPYNLSALNNLLEAGMVRESVKDNPEILGRLAEIVPSSKHISPDAFTIYSFEHGSCKNLIDKETGLILADILDAVSDEISIEFGELLDLEPHGN